MCKGIHRRWERILGNAAADVSFVAGSLLDRALLQRTVDEQRISAHHPSGGPADAAVPARTVCRVRSQRAGKRRSLRAGSNLGGTNSGDFLRRPFYAVYGPEADDQPLGETAAKNQPPSFYGAYKLAVDLIAQQYWRHFGIASVGIRPHVAYGPERTVGLTAGPSLAARAAARGESYTINYTGSVGYDYVEDVSRAFVQAASKPPRGSVVVDLPSQLATTEEFVRAPRPDHPRHVIPGHGKRPRNPLQHSAPAQLHL